MSKSQWFEVNGTWLDSASCPNSAGIGSRLPVPLIRMHWRTWSFFFLHRILFTDTLQALFVHIGFSWFCVAGAFCWYFFCKYISFLCRRSSESTFVQYAYHMIRFRIVTVLFSNILIAVLKQSYLRVSVKKGKNPYYFDFLFLMNTYDSQLCYCILMLFMMILSICWGGT